MKKMTHTGTYIDPLGNKRVFKFRETKLYWISEHGTKYKKYTGTIAGEKFPMARIDLDSIKPIQENK